MPEDRKFKEGRYEFSALISSTGVIQISPLTFPEVTLEKLQALPDYSSRPRFHYNNRCRCVIGVRNSFNPHAEEWRANGDLRTWKTRPGNFRVPLKFGMWDYGELTHVNRGLFHLAVECPLGALPPSGANVRKFLKTAGMPKPTPGGAQAFPFTITKKREVAHDEA